MANIRTLAPRTKRLAPALITVASRNVRKRTSQWYRDVGELRRTQPYCVLCAQRGVQVVAVETDHIVPLHRGGTNAMANLQRLCIPCHEAKSKEEQQAQYVY